MSVEHSSQKIRTTTMYICNIHLATMVLFENQGDDVINVLVRETLGVHRPTLTGTIINVHHVDTCASWTAALFHTHRGVSMENVFSASKVPPPVKQRQRSVLYNFTHTLSPSSSPQMFSDHRNVDAQPLMSVLLIAKTDKPIRKGRRSPPHRGQRLPATGG